MSQSHNDCLVVVDLQNDFCQGGALEVPDADAIVPLVNRLGRHFSICIASQDWHPPGHQSFASSHPGRQPFDTVEMPYGTQVLWPDHCVQESSGAAFHPEFDDAVVQSVVRKGFRPEIDSYSTFFENDHTTSTGLAGYLRDRGISRLYFCGLATDFCVAWSARDAAAQGFEAYLIEDACRAIDLDGSLDQAWSDLQKAGVERVVSADILD